MRTRVARWTVVVVGAIVALVLWWATARVVFAFVQPLLYDATTTTVNGTTSGTARGQTIADVSLALCLAFACWLSFFVGGLLVGAAVRNSPGKHAMAATVLAFVGLFATVSPTFYEVVTVPDDASRWENISLVTLWAVAFCVVSPLAVLSSFLGGRLAGRLR